MKLIEKYFIEKTSAPTTTKAQTMSSIFLDSQKSSTTEQTLESSIFFRSCESVFGFLYNMDIKDLIDVIKFIAVSVCKDFKIEKPFVCNSILYPEIENMAL